MGITTVVKTYRTLGHKRFMEKFMEGVHGITPLQNTKTQLYSTVITLAGIILGIIASCIFWQSSWWLAIILIGAAGVSIMQIVGFVQKIKALEDIEKIQNQLNTTLEE